MHLVKPLLCSCVKPSLTPGQQPFFKAALTKSSFSTVAVFERRLPAEHEMVLIDKAGDVDVDSNNHTFGKHLPALKDVGRACKL